MDYDELVKRGYWVGVSSAYKDRCTCPHPTLRDEYGDKHRTTCPRWVPEWTRRNLTKDMTH